MASAPPYEPGYSLDSSDLHDDGVDTAAFRFLHNCGGRMFLPHSLLHLQLGVLVSDPVLSLSQNNSIEVTDLLMISVYVPPLKDDVLSPHSNVSTVAFGTTDSNTSSAKNFSAMVNAWSNTLLDHSGLFIATKILQ
jgi:hypothetical protein